MAQVQYEMPVRLLHGKTHQKSKGYYYVIPEGKQKYRTREENYLQQLSEEAAKKTEAQSTSTISSDCKSNAFPSKSKPYADN